MLIRFLIVLLFVALPVPSNVLATTVGGDSKLWVMGFDADSAGRYGYLANSVRAMFVSRLSATEGVIIEDRLLTQDELQRLKAGTLDREAVGLAPGMTGYLLRGEIVELAAGLDIQLTLFPMDSERKVAHFSGIARQPEELLELVGNLVGEIRRSLAVPRENGKEMAGPRTGAPSGFVTAHPETEYKRSQYGGTIVGAPGSTLTVSTIGMKKSLDLPMAMEAMGLGDLDGDGKSEILLVSGNRLERVLVRDRELVEGEAFTLPKGNRYHSVAVADTDGNGEQEIYVSGTDETRASSVVLKWDDRKGFQMVASNVRWYLRPIQLANGEWRLAGQRDGQEKTKPVSPGVFWLEADSSDNAGDYNQGEQLALPAGVNLFDFIYVDLQGDGRVGVAAIDDKQKLRIYSSTNELIWISKQNYGGSQVYLGPSMGSASDEQSKSGLSVREDAVRDLVFVPPPLVAADLDGDGGQEIIVNENNVSSMNLFFRLRLYNGGAVVGLKWQNDGLGEVWRTGNFRGFVAGYGLREVRPLQPAGAESGKRQGRLFVGSLPNSGSFMGLLPGTGTTRITVYDLGFELKNPL